MSPESSTRCWSSPTVSYFCFRADGNDALISRLNNSETLGQRKIILNCESCLAALNNSIVCVRRIRDHHHRRCQNLRLTRQQVQRGRRRHQTGHPVPHGSVVHLTAATRCKSSQMGVTFSSGFVRHWSRMSVRKMETADSILSVKTVTLQETS